MIDHLIELAAEFEAAKAAHITPPRTGDFPVSQMLVCTEDRSTIARLLRSEAERLRGPAWDANENRKYEPVETLAKEIYDALPYDGSGQKPAWIPHGNSWKQDDARFAARYRLRAAGHSPSITSKEL